MSLYSILQPTFGTELYPICHPDPDGLQSSVASLYAIYTQVGGSVFSTLKNTDDLTRQRMQVSIYGLDYNIVKTKSLAVIAAMKTANANASQAVANRTDPLTVTGSLPNSMLHPGIDDYEANTKRFVKHLEFYCWAR